MHLTARSSSTIHLASQSLKRLMASLRLSAAKISLASLRQEKSIYCDLAWSDECADSCPELSKLKALKMLDLETKSAIKSIWSRVMLQATSRAFSALHYIWHSNVLILFYLIEILFWNLFSISSRFPLWSTLVLLILFSIRFSLCDIIFLNSQLISIFWKFNHEEPPQNVHA